MSLAKLYRQSRKAVFVAISGAIILFVNELFGVELPIPADGDPLSTLLTVAEHVLPMLLEALFGGGIAGLVAWVTKNEPYTGKVTKGL